MFVFLIVFKSFRISGISHFDEYIFVMDVFYHFFYYYSLSCILYSAMKIDFQYLIHRSAVLKVECFNLKRDVCFLIRLILIETYVLGCVGLNGYIFSFKLD